MGIKPMEHVVEWAESGLADWQEGDADSYVSENGHPSWENIMGYVLAAEADISALKQQIELEAIISGLAQDENAALKRENKRYSGALYDAMCLTIEHDDDIFSDIRLDHLMGVALLTAQESE